MKPSIKVDFISDYVCPYCLVAKAALKEAIEAMKDEIDVEIIEHSFELTVAPAPQVDTYHDETRKAHYQVLVEPCKTLGLDMKLPPAVVPRPYTRLAFEGFYYAKAQGLGAKYSDAVYKAYFIDEKNIGELDVLCELAAQVGLDVDGFKAALEQGTYTKDVEAANDHARKTLGVKHVPTIYMDGQEIMEQIYTKEGFMDILALYRDLNSYVAEPGVREFHGCGADGCF